MTLASYIPDSLFEGTTQSTGRSPPPNKLIKLCVWMVVIAIKK